MTRIKNNAMLKNLSGKFGDTHQYRKVRGKHYMVNLPEPTEQKSPKQLEIKDKFSRATNYGKAQMLDEVARAEYETGITKKKFNAYLVAVSDMLLAPTIKEIQTDDYLGQVGNPVMIDATDDFKVVRVRVILTDSNGVELERGEAVQDLKIKEFWYYTATVANPTLAGTKISATAFDTPKNQTLFEKVLA